MSIKPNILVGFLFLFKIRHDLEEYELSRIIPPSPDHRLRIYGIMRRLGLVPVYCPECPGHGQSKVCCHRMFAEAPDNLVRLACDILTGDGYWEKGPEEIPPGEVEGRREFVQHVLGEEPEFRTFIAADTDWHAQPTTKTKLRALLKQELETPYYFILN